MRSDGNLVTVDLVVAASQMLFFSGGEPLRKTGLLTGADAPGFELAPVLEKVSVHPRKFAPEVTSWRLRMGSSGAQSRADCGGFGRGP